ncbi:MAG: phage major capsid protein [Gammaproteobacteria bacterium]|nr:phage major capsid protein [Gammaproteobacteria bacterium]
MKLKSQELQERADALIEEYRQGGDKAKLDEANRIIDTIPLEKKREAEAAVEKKRLEDAEAEKKRKEEEAKAEAEKKRLEKEEAEKKRREQLARGLPPPTGNPGEPVAIIKPEYEVRTERAYYVRKYGTFGEQADRMTRELYSEDIGLTDKGEAQKDFYEFTAEKYRAFGYYLRTGKISEKRMERNLVLHPSQIAHAVGNGYTVAEVRNQMSSTSDIEGGFIVPEDWRMGIIGRLPEINFFRMLADVVPTTRDTISNQLVAGTGDDDDDQYPSAVRAYFTGESGNPDNTSLGWENVKVEIHILMAVARVPLNHLEDAAVPLVEKLERDMATAIAIREQQKFLTGTGTGEPLGLLKDKGKGGPAHDDMVTYRTGAATAWNVSNIRKTPLQLPEQYQMSQNLAWAMSRVTLAEIAGMTSKDGVPIWANMFMPLKDGVGSYAELMGARIHQTANLADITTTENWVSIYGDWMGYQVGDRIGFSVERVRDATLMRANAVEFIGRSRVGGAPIEPWRFVAIQAKGNN